LELQCHPETPCGADIAISVTVDRRESGLLALDFRVTGDVPAVRWPVPSSPERTDGLWQTTCFEAFVKWAGGESYAEYNFAPSRAWAAYRFDRYREGMADLDVRPTSFFATTHNEARLIAEVACYVPGEWQLGVSAVIEEADGRKSYWALEHPPGKPDFHHADCFALHVAAEKGA
jgi:hypothetical protein